MKPRQAAALGAVLGFLVPFIIGAMSPITGNWIFVVWPSCVVLPAAVFGLPMLIFAISIALNALAYSLAFWFLTNLCLSTIALFEPPDYSRFKEK